MPQFRFRPQLQFPGQQRRGPNVLGGLALLVALLCVVGQLLLATPGEAKLLRSSRGYYDRQQTVDPYDPYGPIGAAASRPLGVATGERALVTVRGARNNYFGAAPGKIAIEDQPYRGAYPRGVYDRLEPAGGYGRYDSLNGPYGPLSSSSMLGGYGRPPYGASMGYGSSSFYNSPSPGRIAVTGAYPYGYGSRW